MGEGHSSILDGLITVAAPDVYARRGDVWEAGGPDFGGDIRALAAALIGYGLTPGGRVAVLGDGGPDALKAQFAVIAAGGCLVDPAPGLSDNALANALATSEIVQAIASDERQLSRLLALRPDLPSLELILLMKARPSERKPASLIAAAAIDAGRAALASEPQLLRSALAATKPSDPAVHFWRVAGAPGTLSRGGLTDLSRRLATTLKAIRSGPTLLVLDQGSAVRLAAVAAVASRDGTILLAEPSERADSGLADRRLHSALLSMEAVERLRRAWLDEIDRKPWPSRAVTRWALGQAPGLDRGYWKWRVAERLTLSKIRGRMAGVGQLDVVRHKGSRIPKETETFFAVVGLPLRYFESDMPMTAGPPIARPV
jgi:hypothetical protein